MDPRQEYVIWLLPFDKIAFSPCTAQKERQISKQATLNTLCRPNPAMQTAKHQISQPEVLHMAYSHSDTDNCQGQKWNRADVQMESLCLFSVDTY